MGRARNQRAKCEGTYLEQVKDSIQQLRSEVRAIKVSVDKLQTHPQQFTWPSEHIWSQDDFCAGWYFPSPVTDQQCWNILAEEFSPEVDGSIDRDTLLAYRRFIEPDTEDTLQEVVCGTTLHSGELHSQSQSAQAASTIQ